MKTAYSGNSGSQDMDRKALGLSDPSILETTVSHEPFKVPPPHGASSFLQVPRHEKK